MSLIDAAQKKAAAAANSKGKVYVAKNTYYTPEKKMPPEQNMPSMKEESRTKEITQPDISKNMPTGNEHLEEMKANQKEEENAHLQMASERKEMENAHLEMAKKDKEIADENEERIKNKAKEYIYKKVGEGKVEKIEKK